MRFLLTALLLAFTLTVFAQRYSYPNIDPADTLQLGAALDTAFAGIGRGHVAVQTITGKDKELTREMLEYLQNRIGADLHHQVINCYPIGGRMYRVQVACNKADTLKAIFTLDVTILPGRATVDLPLWQDTHSWAVKQAGTIRYLYDHDFDPKAAHAFDAANKRIARRLGLRPDSLNFYLADNFQQIMQWLGLAYDRQTAGATRDGFNIEQTIFAIQHNEDFSHDLVHYYVYKVRKGPRNGYAEEGVAYYWGNAYYTDANGQMITLDQLKTALRAYLSAHPGTDLLAAFRKNQRGLFGPAKEISIRSTLSGVIAEYIDHKYGATGVLRLLNCGAGEATFFTVTQSLAGVDAGNFDVRMRELLKNWK
jgi:hypothetical protein